MKISSASENVISNSPALEAKLSPSASSVAQSAASTTPRSPGVAVTMSAFLRPPEDANGGSTAVIDTAKVKSVRAAISQGTYVVNPEVIADRLLSNAQEMLRRP